MTKGVSLGPVTSSRKLVREAAPSPEGATVPSEGDMGQASPAQTHDKQNLAERPEQPAYQERNVKQQLTIEATSTKRVKSRTATSPTSIDMHERKDMAIDKADDKTQDIFNDEDKVRLAEALKTHAEKIGRKAGADAPRQIKELWQEELKAIEQLARKVLK